MPERKPTDSNPPTQFLGTLQAAEEVEELVARPPTLRVQPERPAAPTVLEAERFRPRQRPPIPLLMILDDNQTAAETFRIRKSPFRIGRVEGDLIIPLDLQMSASHAEIFVENGSGQWLWHLRDTGSTNGTFVRVNQVPLKGGRLILIGQRRFRVEMTGAEAVPTRFVPDRTQTWPPSQSARVSSGVTLVDLDAGQEGRRYPLDASEYWIGRDPRKCSIHLDDPLVSPQHARLYRDDRNTWQVENHGSLNGVWAQIDELAMDKSVFFQCGEQRFQFKLVMGCPR